MDVLRWIDETIQPTGCDTIELIYDEMDSQSGHSLPIIYEPFDASDKWHWRDRGALYDYLLSVRGTGARLLDFGPGDGWPSLLVAPFVGEVVGVDGSAKRVDVCTENARRLEISNASYVFAAPDAPLPFDDESFDGVMAATSVEQTPDPRATLRELHRVLRPGGRARFHYEALGRYRDGQERALWLQALGEDRCRLILYDRDIDGESARQYALTYAMPKSALVASLVGDGDASTAGDQVLAIRHITVPGLSRVSDSCVGALVCTTSHPCGETLAGWLSEVGFREVRPTHGGSPTAGMLFDALEGMDRPTDLPGVDALVRPVAEIACQLEAPLSADPMMTAVK